MASYGYSYVPDTAFVAFQSDLSEGGWKSVSIAKHLSPEMMLTAAALGAPRPVLWKLKLTWATEGLVQAIGAGNLDKLDGAWDAGQRRLYHGIAIHLDAAEEAKRAAAERLRGLLLQGGGTGQTQLDYDSEVDFGRQQLRLVAEGQAAADVKLLNLGDVLSEVAQTTEALAKGVGRKAGAKRASARSVRQREALTECITTFNGVHDDIAWFIAHMPSGEERDELTALLAPLDALLARNPPPASVAAPPKAPDTSAPKPS